MRLIPGFRWNYLVREESNQISLAQIILGQMIEDFTNSIAWYIRLNLDMTFQIKVVED